MTTNYQNKILSGIRDINFEFGPTIQVWHRITLSNVIDEKFQANKKNSLLRIELQQISSNFYLKNS